MDRDSLLSRLLAEPRSTRLRWPTIFSPLMLGVAVLVTVCGWGADGQLHTVGSAWYGGVITLGEAESDRELRGRGRER